MSNVREKPKPRIIIATELAGLTHATTRGAIELFERGISTTSRLITVGPWAKFAAQHLSTFDCGVALSFTSYNPLFPLSPITSSPTLIDGRGFFPFSRAEFWEFADPKEVLRECRAQLERAVDLGINPTHISSLDESLILRPEFFDVFVEVASEFKVGVSLGTSNEVLGAGYVPREIISEENLITTDKTLSFKDFPLNSTKGAITSFERLLQDLDIKTCELAVEAAIYSQETIDVFGIEKASAQKISLEALTLNRARRLLEEYGVKTISYQELMEESSKSSS
ncbi:MAG: ChbG/HpnK family deacetylase [Actinomycetota bacterium]|nr:ChbG/HpnK family deacetylase [Actinomycetota bacterium]